MKYDEINFTAIILKNVQNKVHRQGQSNKHQGITTMMTATVNFLDWRLKGMQHSFSSLKQDDLLMFSLKFMIFLKLRKIEG